MLQDDARKIAAAIEERVAGDTAVSATVEAEKLSPSTVPRGAGRPTFIRYQIKISDGVRVAHLNLGQAETLVAATEPGCNPDQLFDAIRANDVPVESVS